MVLARTSLNMSLLGRSPINEKFFQDRTKQACA